MPRHEGVRTARYKLIHFYTTHEFNLFDLETDPRELKDVSQSPRYQETLVAMKSRLEALRESYDLPPLKQ